MSNNVQPAALAKVTPRTEVITPFTPRGIEEAEALAEYLAKSSLLPEALRGKPADIYVTIATGHELGLSPMKAIRGIHVIKGKPVIAADMLVALCLSHPDVCEFFALVSSNALEATYTTRRAGNPTPTTLTYTLDEAQKAGLAGKDTWKQHPAAMLRARASSALARAVYPDLVHGIYTPDESENFTEPEGTVTVVQRPATVAPPAPPPRPAAQVAKDWEDTPKPTFVQPTKPAPQKVDAVVEPKRTHEEKHHAPRTEVAPPIEAQVTETPHGTAPPPNAPADVGYAPSPAPEPDEVRGFEPRTLEQLLADAKKASGPLDLDVLRGDAIESKERNIITLEQFVDVVANYCLAVQRLRAEARSKKELRLLYAEVKKAKEKAFLGDLDAGQLLELVRKASEKVPE